MTDHTKPPTPPGGGVDLAELERLVDAATPGPWRVGYEDGSGMSSITAHLPRGSEEPVVFGGSPEGDIEYGVEGLADALYIAAANPQTIRVLLDIVKAARQHIADQDAWIAGGMNSDLGAVADKSFAALRTALEAVK